MINQTMICGIRYYKVGDDLKELYMTEVQLDNTP